MLEKSLNDTINACIQIPNTFHIQICFNIVVIKKKKTTTTTRCVTSRVWVWNYCLEWLKVRGLRFIFLGYHYPINLILIYDKKNKWKGPNAFHSINHFILFASRCKSYVQAPNLYYGCQHLQTYHNVDLIIKKRDVTKYKIRSYD